MRLNDRGVQLADTDWHLDHLYAGLAPTATVIAANFHRYLIDANRPPDGKSLYPGRNGTDLCPVTDFDGQPICREGCEPDAQEIRRRLRDYHAPYHAALRTELERVHRQHGVAVLVDCHSIRSHIPHLFDGTLPDLNVGTNDGCSCAPELEEAVLDACAREGSYTHVLNGRFKGGWTTRHHGRPSEGVHAIQMELAQSTHLENEAPPFAYSPHKAERLRPLLQSILEAIEKKAHELAQTKACPP